MPLSPASSAAGSGRDPADSARLSVGFPFGGLHGRTGGDLGRIGAELDAGITLVRDWPQRTALVVGAAIRAQVVATMEQLGVVAVAATPEAANGAAAECAPFVMMLLGADVFPDDAAIDRVRGWHRCAPAARVKLVLPGGSDDPDVLVRAIRAGVTGVVDPADQPALQSALRAGLTRAGETRERVLAIGAHPDDVEIGCGGTLLDHRRRGDRISVLTLSRGAVGGDQASRLHEAYTTAGALGAQLLFGDLPDTEIDGGIDTIRLIENVVRVVDPTVVYVHSAHDNHQDHRAINAATRSATRAVRRVFAYQSPSATNEFLPTQFVNVDAVVHRKVEVLQMFHSQDGRSYLEPELVIAGARYWARHLGAAARYAEPFEVIRSVGELRHSVTAPSYDAADDTLVFPPTPIGALAAASSLFLP